MNNYFQFTLDTSKYGGVYVQFDIGLFANGDWANPNSNVYVNTRADTGSFTVYTVSPTPSYPQASKGGWTTLMAKAASTGSSTTTFRFGVDGGGKDAAIVQLDDIIFYGCRRPDPPTVTKSFSPNPVAVGGTSTLTLTVTNPNASGQTLSGIAIDDYLPADNLQGTVDTNGTAAVTGTGTAFKTQLVAGSFIRIPSTPVNLPNNVTVTQNSKTVTTSSGFTGNVAAGSVVIINSVKYTVAAVASDNSLTLSRNYQAAGATLAASTYKTYKVSSITDDTHLTLASSAASGTGQTISAGLTLAGTPTTTCGSPVVGVTETSTSAYPAISLTGGNLTGTLAFSNASTTVTGTGTAFSSELGAGSILSVPYQLTGTVAVTQNSAVVTGTGTAFTTQLVVGQRISINSVDYIVNGITSNTVLALSTAYTASTASGLNARSYKEYAVASIGSATSLTLSTPYSSAANLSGLTIKAGLAGGSATCTITASVRTSLAGTRTNVSGMVTATESGPNTTSTGYATANLTAVLPPVITKQFGTDPIVTGGASTITFTITNPNPNNALSGVKFTDTFPTSPGNMTVYSPLTTTNTCTTGGTPGTLYRSDGTTALAAGDGSIRLGSSTDTNTATIAAGGSCSITVKVTATTAGTYTNTTGNVAHIINGSTVNGNTASDTLTVNAVNPKISLKKQVGTTSTGPMVRYPGNCHRW